jgi:hypothetical protein
MGRERQEGKSFEVFFSLSTGFGFERAYMSASEGSMCVQICRVVGGFCYCSNLLASLAMAFVERKPNYPLKLKIITDGFVKNTFSAVIVGGWVAFVISSEKCSRPR